jgi:hypothetical protein
MCAAVCAGLIRRERIRPGTHPDGFVIGRLLGGARMQNQFESCEWSHEILQKPISSKAVPPFGADSSGWVLVLVLNEALGWDHGGMSRELSILAVQARVCAVEKTRPVQVRQPTSRA